MGSLGMMNYASFSVFRSSRGLELDSDVQGKGNLRLWQRRRVFGVDSSGARRRVKSCNRVCCKLQDGDNTPDKNSREPPESLFMKELRRRGISSTSLLDEINKGTIEEELIEEGGNRSLSKKNSTATGFGKSLTNQRETSMALNSEGLEGLIPRGKLLLRLGGTFFLAFWPLIILIVASFAALYLYFGPTFVHDGRDKPIAPPQYIDPYVVLEEERIIK